MSKATTTNPATGALIASYARVSNEELRNLIESANNAFQVWKGVSIEQRAQKMRKLAQILRSNKSTYAHLITTEMGKMINQAESEIEKSAWVCEFYADNAASFLADEIIETEATKSYISYQAMGAILAVMPWNFPFYQVIRFVAPALMAGNVSIIKHASNVQGCAQALEAAFIEAGFPKGVFTNANVHSSQVKQIIEHPSIVACTLTGSEPAGSSVAGIAGKHIKKTVLELGGNDAYIFLEDVDMEKAVAMATAGRLRNTGQTCISTKRLIVLDEIYDEFVEQFTISMKATKMGLPTDIENDYGPMAREDLRNELHYQVEKSVNQGARLILGGNIPDQAGAYYPATILADVAPGMEAFDEELFGPVAAIIRAKDEAHAIALANNSKFGLGAGVLTSDVDRGERIALQLEAGNCFVNRLVGSDPRLPFGGIKGSGYGRELSKYGIREFVNIKTVYIA